ncbi:pitrilysin family protein [Acidobacterium sp. S8]|uniref:M16 family metallopeptidase n=1 Tax=Acidobacterium sp. S8 TaxID=1641854 RepID=UPI00131ECF90|nr:pitrilysin family protein [Acidobacterium sp. S8]
MRFSFAVCSIALLCGFALAAQAQDLSSFEKRVTTKVLPNGLTLIVCERPEAPVFSYFTIVDAGDANDPGGQSGIAHMFEHLAFKGTKDIGTTDYAAEKVALDKVEEAYAAYDTEYRKRVGRDEQKLKTLHAAFEQAQGEAQKFVIPNQFTEIAESNGATGLNAQTSLDDTQYYWSMPSNRLQLWAYMESDRIANPVPREFYKERDVVMEERRMRTDSNPIGKMVEQFLAAAYVAHPYHRPGVGWMSELSQITATEAAAFHQKYYVPANMVIAVAGDVKAEETMPVLEKYFGAIPAGPKPEEMSTIEPPQVAEKSVVLKAATQPLYIEGYHKPDYRDPDDAVYDAIQDIFSNGRTSRLYRSLVRDQQVAAEAEGFSGFPDVKYPGLFAFFAAPNPGHTPEEMRTAIHKEIDKLKTTDVTDDELAMFKTRARADLLRGLGDNQGLAEQLAIYQLRYGDWRELFNQLKKIDAVTKADIRRVANKTFVETNRTYAMVEFQPPAGPPAQQQSQGGAQ